jgi:hypothetical protein
MRVRLSFDSGCAKPRYFLVNTLVHLSTIEDSNFEVITRLRLEFNMSISFGRAIVSFILLYRSNDYT